MEYVRDVNIQSRPHAASATTTSQARTYFNDMFKSNRNWHYTFMTVSRELNERKIDQPVEFLLENNKNECRHRKITKKTRHVSNECDQGTQSLWLYRSFSLVIKQFDNA